MQVAEALADVLALSPEEAGIILRHYKWNPEAVKARWFDGGEEQVGGWAGGSMALPGRGQCLTRRLVTDTRTSRGLRRQ